jgi:hypothetical protein
MSDLLTAIRKAIGPAPRRIPRADRGYLLARPPVWLRPMDRLREFYRVQELLLEQGTVTWGALAHADLHAFEPGPCDVPGTMVYIADPTIEPEPGWLVRAARAYYGLMREEGIDVGDRSYEDWSEATRPRVMDREVPADIAKGMPLRATTIMIRRPHLPAGLVVESCVPILMYPRARPVMIVPCRAWPAAYARRWHADVAGYPALTSIQDFVRIAQPALKPLRQSMNEQGAGPDWYVHVWVPEPTNGFDALPVEITFAPTMDPKRHLLSHSLGLKFIIDQTQADLLAGLVIGRNLPD